jgi:thioredoxin-related protein/YHS domain-containing protein
MVVKMASLPRSIFAVLVTLASAGMFPSGLLAQSQISWAANLEQAQQIAAQERKLVLMHFYSDACEPCLKLEKNVFSRPEVVEAIHRNYVPVKIHGTTNAKIAQQYRVDRWPTDVIVSSTGQEIVRTPSPQVAEQYTNLMHQVALQSGVGGARQWAASMGAAGQQVLATQAGQMQAAGANLAAQAQQAAQQTAQQAQQQGIAAFQQYGQQANAYGQSLAQQADRQVNQAATKWNQTAQGVTAAAGQQLQMAEQKVNAAGQQAAGYASNALQYAAEQQRSAFDTASLRFGNPPVGAAPPAGSAPAATPYGSASTGSVYQPGPAFTVPAVPANPVAQEPQPGTSPTPQVSLPTTNPYVAAAGIAPSELAATTAPGLPNEAPRQPMSAPPAVAATPTGAAPSPALTPEQGLVPASQAPPIALEGYCPVSLLEQRKWLRSDPQFGAIHRGKTYLFATEDAQRKFLANPDGYSPALSGFDPVVFAQRGEMVEGKRSFGITFNRQIFLFADEASLKAFEQSPQSFAAVAYQAMMQAETGPKYR